MHTIEISIKYFFAIGNDDFISGYHIRIKRGKIKMDNSRSACVTQGTHLLVIYLKFHFYTNVCIHVTQLMCSRVHLNLISCGVCGGGGGGCF